MDTFKTKIISKNAPPTTFDLVSITRSGEDQILVLIYSGLAKEIEPYINSRLNTLLHNQKNYDTLTAQFIAIGEATLYSRAAILGGALRKEVFDTFDKFSKMIQKIISSKEIFKATIGLAILYANMVSESKLKLINTPIIYRAVEYIQSHIKNKITCNQVASYLKCSEQYLGRLFKKELNINISAYILKEKIHHSISALSQDEKTLDEIASEYSFCSKSHYVQLFKKIIGVTPHKYKELLIKKNLVN